MSPYVFHAQTLLALFPKIDCQSMPEFGWSTLERPPADLRWWRSRALHLRSTLE
jgi:hypothetical protein